LWESVEPTTADVKAKTGLEAPSAQADKHPFAFEQLMSDKLNRGSRDHITSIYLLRLQLAAASPEEGCLEEFGQAAAAVEAGNQSLQLAEAEEAAGADLAQQ